MRSYRSGGDPCIATATTDDFGAYTACVHAKGQWLEGRTNAQQLKELASRPLDQNKSTGQETSFSRGVLKAETEIELEDGVAENPAPE